MRRWWTTTFILWIFFLQEIWVTLSARVPSWVYSQLDPRIQETLWRKQVLDEPTTLDQWLGVESVLTLTRYEDALSARFVVASWCIADFHVFITFFFFYVSKIVCIITCGLVKKPAGEKMLFDLSGQLVKIKLRETPCLRMCLPLLGAFFIFLESHPWPW